MVEPFTLTLGIGNAINLLARTSLNIYAFVKEVRDAREDLTRVNEELSSLRTTLQFINDDLENAEMSSIAQNLEANLSVVVRACTSTVEEIEGLLARHLQHRKTGSIKWSISGKPDADRSRASLESHKASLNLSLDLIELSLTRAIKQDTTALLDITRGMQELQTKTHYNQQQLLDRVNKLELKPLGHVVSTAQHGYRQSRAGSKSEVAVAVVAPLTTTHSDQRSGARIEPSRIQYPQVMYAGKEHPITSSPLDNASSEVKGDSHYIRVIQSSLTDLHRAIPPGSIDEIGQAESACEAFLSVISTALHNGLSPKQCFEYFSFSMEFPLLCCIMARSWFSLWNENLSKQFLATGRLCLDYGANIYQYANGWSPFMVLLDDSISREKMRYSSQRSEAGIPLQSRWMDLFREYGLDITDGPVSQEILGSISHSYSLVIVTMYISEGLSVDARDSDNGQTMMHFICHRMLKPPHQVRPLLNHLDFQGKEELQFLRLLLARGASLTLKDRDGRTPDNYARELDVEWNKGNPQLRLKRTPEYEQNLK